MGFVISQLKNNCVLLKKISGSELLSDGIY